MLQSQSQSPSSSLPTLYTYFRSSCSARVRIACHLKGIELSYIHTNLLQGEQHSSEYRTTNPCATVPTLVIPADLPHNNTSIPIVIRQSVAILEFLEEYPAYAHTPKLLPDDPVARAEVRELVNIICEDVQPASNQYILKMVDALNGDKGNWAKQVISRGFGAYEELLKSYSGKFSFGDKVSMADVCMAPAVDAALRWGVDMDAFPLTRRVYETVRVLEPFLKGDWRHQDDTLEEFRTL
ncbi:putative glutathione S-transferase [Hyphodiscus hymeniophilus]|uniref:Glutathione S-transferase n=1 Tax=Hyphodiscus hymeniophilus TaxID=353542 RepID=A0A9P6VQI1_9HELO|nr:putative glutathione S-transferase [Hyphodiscus hymeniophilus]